MCSRTRGTQVSGRITRRVVNISEQFLAEYRALTAVRPSYRHEEPTSPGTCISLRTRRSQVRVLQGAPIQQLTATNVRWKNNCEQFCSQSFRIVCRAIAQVTGMVSVLTESGSLMPLSVRSENRCSSGSPRAAVPRHRQVRFLLVTTFRSFPGNGSQPPRLEPKRDIEPPATR